MKGDDIGIEGLGLKGITYGVGLGVLGLGLSVQDSLGSRVMPFNLMVVWWEIREQNIHRRVDGVITR